jgi:1-deoxy-D-xylulose-5-phosphate synthase
VAVIGDGSLGSGVALEALNQVREHGKRLVIVLNDNKMAISQSVGSIRRALNRMMTSYRYLWIKNAAKGMIRILPHAIQHHVSRLEDAAKSLLLPGGIFDEMGIRYLGPINGHDVAALERTFKSVQRDDRPVLIHVVTEKGRGYAPASDDPERFHGIGKFDKTDGKVLAASVKGFSHAFGEAACRLAEKNPDLTAVVAAMTGFLGRFGKARKAQRTYTVVQRHRNHTCQRPHGIVKGLFMATAALISTTMNVYQHRQAASLGHSFRDPNI